MRKKPSELDFEEYIRQVEPAKREKSYAWSTAIGLQQVDGLTPSDYLLEVAKKNIEGKISLNKAQALIDSYYESKTERTDDQDEKEEADKVSARIAQVLSEKAFSFSPFFFISIHKRLFDHIFKHAGEIRKYNISKKEWVLNGQYSHDCRFYHQVPAFHGIQGRERHFRQKFVVFQECPCPCELQECAEGNPAGAGISRKVLP